MLQHELRSPPGARRQRKRVGRGNASGRGTYAGKGIKGQQARSGRGPHPGFEGGQTPLIRRLARRRGFHNPFRSEYQPVNLRALANWPVEREVTPESLHQAGVVRTTRRPIKILGLGDAAPFTVRVHRVSASARSKIEAAGGSVEELTPRPPRAEPKGKRTETAVPEEQKQAAEAESGEDAVQAADEETDGSSSKSSESTGAH